MHTILGRIVKYVLWILLITILSFLFIGLAKHNFDAIGYVKFLNNRDWNQAWSKGSVSYMFRGDDIIETGDLILETGLDMDITGDVLSGDNGSGLDVFDPSMEADLNQINNSDLSGDASATDDFGFVNDGSQQDIVTGDSKVQLLQQLKK